MKKILIGLASIAVCGSALAQSSVTLFGLVDTKVGYGKGSLGSRTTLGSSGTGANRLGFRGVEDLGGGMSASFWLEAGVATDSGEGSPTDSANQVTGTGPAVAGRQGLTFNRRSTVSLAGSFGEVRLGRDITPILWSQSIFDPFAYLGVGGIVHIVANLSGPIGVRASNSVSYFLPGNLGGFYGQFMHHLGENLSGTATSRDGNGSGLRAGYAAGPVDVAFAIERSTYASGNINSANLAGSYDFGVAKMNALYQRDEVVGRVTGKGWLIGARAPVGVGELKAALSSYKGSLASADAQTDKLALGYVHNLSKRTAVYGTIARVHNKGGAAVALNSSATSPNGSSSGFDLGVRHSF